MQQFLVPDQTPPILEAEMSLKAEQVVKSSKQGRSSAQSDGRSSSQRLIVSPDPANKKQTKQAVTSEPPKQQQDMRSEKKNKKTPQAEKEDKERVEEVKKAEKEEESMEERQEPDGRQADTTITEHDRKEVRMLLSSCMESEVCPEVIYRPFLYNIRISE